MVDELLSIEENKTWDAIDHPTSHSPISLKWVFKAKKDESGCIMKHKAQLIAKGFVQRQGWTLKKSLPSSKDGVGVHNPGGGGARMMAMHHMDVKSTFLNLTLLEASQLKYTTF
jgi:hypothetical protein